MWNIFSFLSFLEVGFFFSSVKEAKCRRLFFNKSLTKDDHLVTGIVKEALKGGTQQGIGKYAITWCFLCFLCLLERLVSFDDSSRF